MIQRFYVGLLVMGILMGGVADAALAQINIDTPMPVRILVDNSGSMYPGYRLSGGVKRPISGVGFFHEYPEFREKLAQLIELQSRFNGQQVELAVFTDDEIDSLLGPVPCHRVSADTLAEAFAKLRSSHGKWRYGQYTELEKSLERFISGFTGIVWLITDNVIDTRSGSHDNSDLQQFFRTIKDKPYYKSMHLFKYPFQDMEKGQDSNLAVYGMLVAQRDVSPEVIAYFDRKFRSLKSYFNGHLQFKDLTISPVEVDAPVEVEILDNKARWFSSTQVVKFTLKGKIKSNLTQHTITGGKYKIAVEGPFKTDQQTADKYGLPKEISSANFRTIRGNFGSIPPQGAIAINEELSSKKTFNLTPRTFLGFLSSAFGMQATYTGRIVTKVFKLNVKFEPEQLNDIYGVDVAKEVFNIFETQNLRTIDNVKSVPRQKSFILKSSGKYALILLLICLLLLLALGACIWFIGFQSEACEILTNGEKQIVPMNRIKKHPLEYQQKRFGHLSRGLGGEFAVIPNTILPRLAIKSRQSADGIFDVTLKEGKFVLQITPMAGGKVRPIDYDHMQQIRPDQKPPPKMPPQWEKPSGFQSTAGSPGSTDTSHPKADPGKSQSPPPRPGGPPPPPPGGDRYKPK